jgi:hypothetical protein
MHPFLGIAYVLPWEILHPFEKYLASNTSRFALLEILRVNQAENMRRAWPTAT